MKIEVKFEFDCDNDNDRDYDEFECDNELAYDKSYLEEVALASIRDAEDILEDRGFKIVRNSLQIKTLEEAK